jgi:hypothetical protein
MAYSDWPYARRIAVAVRTFFEFIASLTFSWRFTDLPSHVAMALDEIARVFTAIGDKAASARAFISRALKHPSYTAGHFDPGRMPA